MSSPLTPLIPRKNPKASAAALSATKLELRAQALWKANRAHIYSIWVSSKPRRLMGIKGRVKRGWKEKKKLVFSLSPSRRWREGGKTAGRRGPKAEDLIGCNLVRLICEGDERKGTMADYEECPEYKSYRPRPHPVKQLISTSWSHQDLVFPRLLCVF